MTWASGAGAAELRHGVRSVAPCMKFEWVKAMWPWYQIPTRKPQRRTLLEICMVDGVSLQGGSGLSPKLGGSLVDYEETGLC